MSDDFGLDPSGVISANKHDYTIKSEQAHDLLEHHSGNDSMNKQD